MNGLIKINGPVKVLLSPVSERYCRVGDTALLDIDHNQIRCGGVWFSFNDKWIVEPISEGYTKGWTEGFIEGKKVLLFELNEIETKLISNPKFSTYTCIPVDEFYQEHKREEVENLWKYGIVYLFIEDDRSNKSFVGLTELGRLIKELKS
jgi:hypothetical protein